MAEFSFETGISDLTPKLGVILSGISILADCDEPDSTPPDHT
jgi:hypothetical protein